MTKHLDPIKVFKQAIRVEHFSESETDSNYVGNYMYMYSELTAFTVIHYFKHIESREYNNLVCSNETGEKITLFSKEA